MLNKIRDWGDSLGCFAFGVLVVLIVILTPVWLPFAVLWGLVQSLRTKQKIALIDDDTVRQMLAAADLGELPEVLRAPAPRLEPSFEGLLYLDQGRYRQRYMPLLLQGHATRGLCVFYEARGGGDDYDAHCIYAWIDTNGQVRRGEISEGYDAENAGRGRGRGTIVWDMDAGLGTARAVTIVYDDEDHVLFDAFVP